MSRKYKFGDNDKLYFISFSVVHWIDVFIRNEYKEILLESWRFCQKQKDLEIYGWCIMTSHVHMIVGTKSRPLDKIIGEMKGFTSTSSKKARQEYQGESRKVWMMERAGKKNSNNNDWQFWQQHNKPLEILNIEMFYQKLSYIHHNPVEAGFVANEEDWIFSSARDFHGKKGLIELCYVVQVFLCAFGTSGRLRLLQRRTRKRFRSQASPCANPVGTSTYFAIFRHPSIFTR